MLFDSPDSQHQLREASVEFSPNLEDAAIDAANSDVPKSIRPTLVAS